MSEPPLRFGKSISAFSILGYGLFFFWTGPGAAEIAGKLCKQYALDDVWWAVFCGAGWLLATLALALSLRLLWGAPRRALLWLFFCILPLWGLVLNADSTDQCRRECPADVYRAFASPEIYGLLLLHLLTAGGYAISRRRREDLPARAEPWVVALLLVGLVLHVALAIQIVDLLGWLLLFPVTLPLLTPFVLMCLFLRELMRRLRASAARAQAPPSLGPALLRSPLVVGAHALIQALWLGRPSSALDVFARTCTHAFSTLPLEVQSSQCGHYLCTIAARGHPALVRPERLGVRRGQLILVNRQLAIANAFEDLLHTRWPRLGRLARASYDRLAIPICQLIRSRWLADLLYLVMKPAEWLFYLTLLIFDREPPEARIERMYR